MLEILAFCWDSVIITPPFLLFLHNNQAAACLFFGPVSPIRRKTPAFLSVYAAQTAFRRGLCVVCPGLPTRRIYT
jgi:hypothetical protein